MWGLQVDLYIYCSNGGNDNLSPGEVLNPLLDAIEVALAPDNIVTRKCTLGGLVQHCWIEGTVETFEGTLGDREVAIVPIIIKFA